jgi:mannose-6-phosphate isomerase-like protein (cupin superfamily)
MKTFDRPKRVEKPWGFELWWAQTDRYVGKLLHVNAGHQLSLQYHERKDETIHLWSGELKLALDEKDGAGLNEHVLRVGESYHVRPGVATSSRSPRPRSRTSFASRTATAG